jgi:hypothetical protein
MFENKNGDATMLDAKISVIVPVYNIIDKCKLGTRSFLLSKSNLKFFGL